MIQRERIEKCLWVSGKSLYCRDVLRGVCLKIVRSRKSTEVGEILNTRVEGVKVLNKGVEGVDSVCQNKKNIVYIVCSICR